ncbi:STAS/SEC14 domain-containing protein [Salinicoccus siamensis]|uniref:STAS/SEC14 domain-containing protein n=1 Tax=Salinicoccus siamensis TaxID=381830 RepID=A0ABV5Z2W4_9STAP
MMKIEESRYPNTVYIEMDGELSESDVRNAEAFINDKYGGNQKLSGLIYIKDLEGTDADAFLSGSAVDLKHWKQYKKFAFVSNQPWVDLGSSVINWLPGIEVQHFDKAEINKAWEWIQR